MITSLQKKRLVVLEREAAKSNGPEYDKFLAKHIDTYNNLFDAGFLSYDSAGWHINELGRRMLSQLRNRVKYDQE